MLSILTTGTQFIYDCDDQLYARRWETVIANRDKVDIVQLLTWNDFGESHYLGPVHGNLPPGADAWTTGFDHRGTFCSSNLGHNLNGCTDPAARLGRFPRAHELLRNVVQDRQAAYDRARSIDHVGAPAPEGRTGARRRAFPADQLRAGAFGAFAPAGAVVITAC